MQNITLQFEAKIIENLDEYNDVLTNNIGKRVTPLQLVIDDETNTPVLIVVLSDDKTMDNMEPPISEFYLMKLEPYDEDKDVENNITIIDGIITLKGNE